MSQRLASVSSVADDQPPSGLERLNAIATFVARGAPICEVGYEHDPGPTGTAPTECEEALILATGLLGDRRRDIPAGDERHGLFAHALRHQDGWSAEEHHSFWHGALGLWPKPKGADQTRDALAYAVTVAVFRQLDLQVFLSEMSEELAQRPPVQGISAAQFTPGYLQRVGIIHEAIHMLSAPRHLHHEIGRLPRVFVDSDRFDIPPPTITGVGLDTVHGTAGAATREIVEVANLVGRRLAGGTEPPSALQWVDHFRAPDDAVVLCSECIANWDALPQEERFPVALSSVAPCAQCGFGPEPTGSST
jgi:hypothetical protein